MDPVPEDSPKYSSNPVVRIVANNTSPKQPAMISEQRIKLHAAQGSLDVDSVEDLLEDAVADGELEEQKGVYRVPE